MTAINVHFFLLAAIAIGASFASSCSKEKFRSQSSNRTPSTPVSPPPVVPSPVVEQDPETLEIKPGFQVAGIKPVFAIREPSCLSCHLDIKGDFVSDFMVGTPYFFGSNNFHWKDGIELPNRFSGTTALRPDLMRGLNIDGSLIVPKATIDHPTALEPFKQSSPISLKEALSGKAREVLEWTSPPQMQVVKWSEMNPLFGAIGENRNKSLPGVNQISEHTKIEFQLPTAKQLKEVFSKNSKKTIQSSGPVTIQSESETEKFEGLSIENGISNPFVRNTAEVVCKGDIFIDGTLVLVNAKIRTDRNGCRLYVTGAVFLTGPIVFSKSSEDENLQIVSARPIYAGIKTIDDRAGGLGTDAEFSFASVFKERDNVKNFISDDAGPTYIAIRQGQKNPFAVSYASSKPIDDQVAATNPNYSISMQEGGWEPVASGTTLGVERCTWVGNLDMESNYPAPTSPLTCVVGRNTSYARKQTSYEHVLFAAPAFHSRYQGTIKGTVIAQFAVLALSKARYEFDPIFDKIKLLPALTQPILKIEK